MWITTNCGNFLKRWLSVSWETCMWVKNQQLELDMEEWTGSKLGKEYVPDSSVGKESTCNAGDPVLIPELGRSSGQGKGYPLHYCGLENSMDCVVRGIAKSRTRLSDFHFQGCILLLCLFNLCVEYIMQNTRLDESQAGIKIAGRNINNLRYADDTSPMAETEEELKSLLIGWKRKVKKTGLKLNIQTTKIRASGPITSWQIEGRKSGSSDRFYFLELQNYSSGGGLVAKLCPTLAISWTVACQAPLSVGFSRQEYWSGLPFPSPRDLLGPGIQPVSCIAGGLFTDWATGDCDYSCEIKRCLFLISKAMIDLYNVLKSRDITLLTKFHIVKALFFSSSHVWLWVLDHKEGWVPNNWCFELWCWGRLLRVPWSPGTSSQS